MKPTNYHHLLVVAAFAVLTCFIRPVTGNSDLIKRAKPSIANGGFEQGPLRPAWTPYITGNASVVVAKQPGKPSNHVCRIKLNCNPCMCDDEECCNADLEGRMLNILPNGSYSITWNFMYTNDVNDVYWLGDASHCTENDGCFTTSFSDVRYVKKAKKNKWYTYSASFTGPGNVGSDGRADLSVYPGGCKNGYTYLDNFKLFGPF